MNEQKRKEVDERFDKFMRKCRNYVEYSGNKEDLEFVIENAKIILHSEIEQARIEGARELAEKTNKILSKIRPEYKIALHSYTHGNTIIYFKQILEDIEQALAELEEKTK